jgi:hypothetical protein
VNSPLAVHGLSEYSTSKIEALNVESKTQNSNFLEDSLRIFIKLQNVFLNKTTSFTRFLVRNPLYAISCGQLNFGV